MNSMTPITAGNRRWGRTVPWVAAGLFVFFLAVLLGGCSTEGRYRTLSFFFDGVPDPHAPAGSAAARGEARSESDANAPIIKAYIHKPYADGKCNACHSGQASGYESYSAVGADTCLKCHKDKLTQYPVMHGPVSAVECTLCHAAHESTIPGMLNFDAPRVCIQCHDRDLLGPKPPEHLAADSKCLSCHVGHGGPKHKLLRIDTVASAATRPTAATPAGAAR
jgi:predicted CXXCH cytochrome family protein